MPHPETMYGYARVSAKDQNVNRQLDALRRFGVSDRCIYTDKASGSDFERPAYKRLMNRLRKGDVLVVKSIDRLGRNYDEILKEWRRITVTKGVAIVIIDIPLLDTRETNDNLTGKLIADVVLQLLSYVAQIEREHIRARQAEGIASAKARGVRFGRPPIKRPGTYEEVKASYLAGNINRKEAARILNISATTFHTWLHQDDRPTAG